MQFENYQQIKTFGNIPLPVFGHTLTPFGNSKVCLFGGANGNNLNFSFNNSVYTFDSKSRTWTKIATNGPIPSARAAHGAACIEKQIIVIYGGATMNGGLASEEIYHLRLKDGIGAWNVINTKGKTPGKRYGHSFTYLKPHLIVFGGNNGQVLNDIWILNVQKNPISWQEIKCEGSTPVPRLYHSCCICNSGNAKNMMIIFGGRNSENKIMGDSWGLRKRRNDKWDWVKTPQQNCQKIVQRMQHTSHFYENFMVNIGGKVNSSQQLCLQIFDINTNQWTNYHSTQVFRHSSWIQNSKIYLFGGYNQTTLTNNMMTIDLQNFIGQKIYLEESQEKMQNLEQERQLQTPIFKRDHKMKQKQSLNTSRQSTLSSSSKKRKKVSILKPIFPKQQKITKETFQNIKHKDIPNYFLNILLKPKTFQNSQNINIKFNPEYINALCDITEDIIMEQPMVLRPKPPLKIFGDIHGQFTDLMSFFDLYGTPHENGAKKDIQDYDYVFLGDFVDRGTHSIETICLLFALKCVYPSQVHLVRGNHQDLQINTDMGFMQECEEKLDQNFELQGSVYQRVNRVFDCLPLGAVIDNKILCLHGGIGGSLKCVEDIQKIKRPLKVQRELLTQQSKIVMDVLWSDPTENDNQLGILPNFPRDPTSSGGIVRFGPDRVQNFLKKNNLQMIIRAHECVMDGFQRFAGGSLITVFSATDYCRRSKNAGAILVIKSNLEIIPKLIYPKNQNANNWIEDEQYLTKRPPTPPRWRNNKHS